MLYTSMLILNMLLEPNFVLDFKQNISTKQRKFPHAKHKSTIVSMLASRSKRHHITQPPSLAPMSKIQKHKKSVTPFSDLCKLWLQLMKPTT